MSRPGCDGTMGEGHKTRRLWRFYRPTRRRLGDRRTGRHRRDRQIGGGAGGRQGRRPEERNPARIGQHGCRPHITRKRHVGHR
ncbi:hypothetical protein EV216_10974 [Rhodovulum steppense]|uniref:Uncharacterized protein n=1 Tax=Rhodovulum steppense TaxID=540251 RepID=A0A4R1YV57_9RHOB|nr:hypothetical protein EV216_10974 [Rhodovulum steppense]